MEYESIKGTTNKMDDTIDTRVGYMTIDILHKELKQYIDIFTDTETKKYKGEPHYINVYNQYSEYLSKD